MKHSDTVGQEFEDKEVKEQTSSTARVGSSPNCIRSAAVSQLLRRELVVRLLDNQATNKGVAIERQRDQESYKRRRYESAIEEEDNDPE